MKKIWSFTLANLDTLIALIVSVGAAIYGVSSGDPLPLLAGIATTLGILAFGLIRDRLHREALAKQIDELKMRLPDRPSAIAFFQKSRDIHSHLQHALQIDMCGVTLTGTLNREYGILRERLQAGAKVRILIIDPDSLAIEMTAQRTGNPQDLDYHRNRLDSSLRELAYIYKRMSEMKPQKGNKLGSFSVKLMSYAPSFGMLSVDVKQKEGISFIEIYPHKFGYMPPLLFDLTPERDQEWFEYFINQFDVMWEAAKSWDPKAYLEKIPFEKNE